MNRAGRGHVETRFNGTIEGVRSPARWFSPASAATTSREPCSTRRRTEKTRARRARTRTRSVPCCRDSQNWRRGSG